MGTKYADLFNRLTADFDPADVKSRDGGGGRQLWYITARTAANRLDEVLGPECWESEYYEVAGCLACRITITLPDGSKVSKSDGGGFKKMTENTYVDGKKTVVTDEENTDKTGFTDAFKRASAMFGIGRYLYNDGMVRFQEDGMQTQVTPAQERPAPSRPRTEDPYAGDYQEPPRQQQPSPKANGQGYGQASSSDTQGPDRPPTNGGSLFAWVKKQEEAHEYPLLDKLKAWCQAKPREWSWNFKLYDVDQVKAAHWQAIQIIAKIHDQSPPQADEEYSQSAPEPATIPAAPKPPLTLRGSDPLLADKQDILKSVAQLTFSTLQRKASNEEVCERIDYIAQECYSGQIVGNLRECKDAGLIRAVKAAAANELSSLRAMGAA